jgi:hypothetical protein
MVSFICLFNLVKPRDRALFVRHYLLTYKMLKPANPLLSLPVEIILQILSFLDSQTTLVLLSTTRNFRIHHLLPKIAFPPDITYKNEIFEFRQNLVLCDKLGCQQSDRCLTTVLPIYYHSLQPKTKQTVAYFEIEIIENCLDAEMRIGLVNNDWDFERPPGSLVDSVGYISKDGHIAVVTGFDR